MEKLLGKFEIIDENKRQPLTELISAKGLTAEDIALILDTVRSERPKLKAYVEVTTAAELEQLAEGKTPDEIILLNGLNLSVRRPYSSEYVSVKEF